MRCQRVDFAFRRKCQELLVSTNDVVNASVRCIVSGFTTCFGKRQHDSVKECNPPVLCASPTVPTGTTGGSVSGSVCVNKDVVLLQTLARFLETGRSRVRAYAVEALYQAALTKDFVKEQLVGGLCVIPKLPQVLCHGTERGSLYAANLLCLLLDCPEAFVQATDSGAPEALLKVAAESKTVGLPSQALKTLGRLVKYREAAGRLVNSNGHVILIQLLLSREVLVVKRVLVVLYYLCADKVHIQYELAKAGLIPVLLGLCTNPGEPVLYQVAEVFKVISRSSFCGRLIEAHGGAAMLEEIMASTSNEKASCALSVALSRLRLTRELSMDLASANPKNQVKPYEVFALEYQQHSWPDVVHMDNVSILKTTKQTDTQQMPDIEIAQPLLVDDVFVPDMNLSVPPFQLSRVSHGDVPIDRGSFTLAPCSEPSVVARSADFGSLYGRLKSASCSLGKSQGSIWGSKPWLSFVPSSASGPTMNALWQQPEARAGADEQLVPLAASLEDNTRHCYSANFEATAPGVLQPVQPSSSMNVACGSPLPPS